MMGGELRLGDASKVVHCSAKKAFKSSDFSRGEEVGVPFSTRVGMLRKDLIPHTDFAVFHQRCVSLTASFEESLEHLRQALKHTGQHTNTLPSFAC